MAIWMKVTNDIYELPVAVADNPRELAKLCGTTANAVKSGVSHVRKGHQKRSSYVKVEEEDINDEY